MCAAFDRIGAVANYWIKTHQGSFPPVVIHLSDGESTDGSPMGWASRLQRLHTSDGNLLLFNVSISSAHSEVGLFLARDSTLSTSYARDLFAMSSVLPPVMLDVARSQGLSVERGARGFGFNADVTALATFLNVGTSVGRLVR